MGATLVSSARGAAVFVALTAAMLAAGCALRAQEQMPVQSAQVPGGTLEQRQQRTGTAYRRLQQVRYEKRIAEQDLLNAQAAYESAQKNADELKRQSDAARKAYAAMQAREKEAEQAYELGIRSVDEIYRSGTKPPVSAR
ncbi:MAG TPA: hypothetical protein VIQ62_01315 [Burkholderiales bacterium]